MFDAEELYRAAVIPCADIIVRYIDYDVVVYHLPNPGNLPTHDLLECWFSSEHLSLMLDYAHDGVSYISMNQVEDLARLHRVQTGGVGFDRMEAHRLEW